jgi:hypothetical protein
MTADDLAEALFCSDLSCACQPTQQEVLEAIAAAMRLHNGVGGCLGDLASEYGDHPELAVARMRWAVAVIEAYFGGRLVALDGVADGLRDPAVS